MLMALVRILLGGFFSGVYKRSKAAITLKPNKRLSSDHKFEV